MSDTEIENSQKVSDTENPVITKRTQREKYVKAQKYHPYQTDKPRKRQSEAEQYVGVLSNSEESAFGLRLLKQSALRGLFLREDEEENLGGLSNSEEYVLVSRNSRTSVSDKQGRLFSGDKDLSVTAYGAPHLGEIAPPPPPVVPPRGPPPPPLIPIYKFET